MKKLKGLGKKNYNVLFHTHTVAGIVISFGLFVIFYAGAFSLFKHQVMQWENPDMRQPVPENFNPDLALKKIDSVYNLSFYKETNVVLPSKEYPVMAVYGARELSDSTTERMAAYINPNDFSVQDIRKPKTTVGETIYLLHYFGQIPGFGLYLSGLVGLFFLFAIVSGILIHWQILLTKFYAFVKEGKWKRIWTNAHTVLGVIGVPFQLIYAITGAFFGLLNLILLPTVFLLYNGDVQQVFNKVNPASALEIEKTSPEYDHHSIADLSQKVLKDFPEHHIHNVSIRNYGREDATATWSIDDDEGILSSGLLTMRMKDGIILEDYSTIPTKRNYSYSVVDFIFKLHFGSFGGTTINLIYFILSMITCFMIISGILIWRTVRDNNNYTLKQRLFHHKTTKCYLAICLSMFPAFSIIFIANKLVPIEMEGRTSLVNQVFFISWLILTIIGLFWNNYARQNKNYLMIGGWLSLLVPIANGIMSGGWIWKMWNAYPSVAYVDLFWFFTGITALYLSFFVLKVKGGSNKPVSLKEETKKVITEPKAKPVLNPQV